MDNFKIIYKILKSLEASLDFEETDVSAISPEKLGVTKARWEQLLIMMQDEGYIKGIVCTRSAGEDKRHIVELIKPVITLKGLEYLSENSFMKKAANLAKGIKDFTL